MNKSAAKHKAFKINLAKTELTIETRLVLLS
jgi:hypothetical protein